MCSVNLMLRIEIKPFATKFCVRINIFLIRRWFKMTNWLKRIYSLTQHFDH